MRISVDGDPVAQALSHILHAHIPGASDSRLHLVAMPDKQAGRLAPLGGRFSFAPSTSL
jgi:hypothetical protein